MPRAIITTYIQRSDSVCIHTHLRAYYTLAIIISALLPLRILPSSCTRQGAARIDIDSLCRGARGWRGREKDGCVTMRKRKRASDEKLVSHSHKWRRESRRDVLTFSTPRSAFQRCPSRPLPPSPSLTHSGRAVLSRSYLGDKGTGAR